MTNTQTTSALQRYQYLLRTSSPDQIEKAHEQAFAAMSEAERREVLQALGQAGETAGDSSAGSLARAATRYEMQRPGGLNQVLGRLSAGTGSNTTRTLAASLAAGFVGSAVWSGVTGGDGLGGRPGLLSRLFGLGHEPGSGAFGATFFDDGRGRGWFDDGFGGGWNPDGGFDQGPSRF